MSSTLTPYYFTSAVDCPGPLLFRFRTKMCVNCRDIRTLYRLSFLSEHTDNADYIHRNPEPMFALLREHGWKDADADPYLYADALSIAFRRSAVVLVDVARLESRRDIRTAFRLEERYTFHGVKRTPVLDKAIRMVRQWEDDGLVCDDYAVILDSAISEIVNRRY